MLNQYLYSLMCFKKKVYFLLHIVLVLIIWSTPIKAQNYEEINQLEQSLKKKFGIEKLRALNKITAYYSKQDSRKSLKNGKQAESLAEYIFKEENVLVDQHDRLEKLIAHYQLGQIYLSQNKYEQAEESIIKARNEAELLNDSLYIVESNNLLVQIDSLGNKEGFLDKMKSLNLGKRIKATSSNLNISKTLTLARNFERLKNYPKAIDQYKLAVNLLRNKGEAQRIAELHNKIAELYEVSGEKEGAIAFYQIATSEYEKLNDSAALDNSQKEIDKLFQRKNEVTKIGADIENSEQVDLLEIQKDIDRYQELAKEYEEKKDYTQSLKYYKQYIELSAQFLEEQQQQKIDSIRLQSQAQEIRLLVQDNDLSEIQILRKNEELTRQTKFRNNLIVGLLLLVVLTVLFYWLFLSKKKAHKALKITFDNLEHARRQLAIAQQKIKKLLGQQVSDEIAQTLLSEETNEENISKYVCIMFLDIRDFTPFASVRKPEEVIAYQNDVFGFMIEIIAEHNGIINQFMGDGFMATFGAPVSHENDVQNAFLSAVKIVEEVNARSSSGVIPTTRVGIGLHAGDVVAGNVGTELRKQYSITGSTVITAARLEQLNKKYASQLLISEEVMSQISDVAPENPECIETTLKGIEEPVKIYKIA